MHFQFSMKKFDLNMYENTYFSKAISKSNTQTFLLEDQKVQLGLAARMAHQHQCLPWVLQCLADLDFQEAQFGLQGHDFHLLLSFQPNPEARGVLVFQVHPEQDVNIQIQN